MSTVVITGCSTGFGLEAALAFARRGDTVVASMRDVRKATTLEERATAEGLKVAVVELDVTDDASVARAVREITADHGTVDVLVNNAGVGYGGPVETMPMDAARALFETNFWGPQRTMRAVLPGMREQRSGVIINVSSLAGLLPGAPYTGLYAASKHALNTVSESLSIELMPFGIRVHCVEPGFFATEIAQNSDAVDTGAGPYGADAAWWKSFMDMSVAAGADPTVVSKLMVGLSADDAAGMHHPVGDDAAMYLALLDQSAGFDDWVATSMPVVEQIAGPRPTVA